MNYFICYGYKNSRWEKIGNFWLMNIFLSINFSIFEHKQKSFQNSAIKQASMGRYRIFSRGRIFKIFADFLFFLGRQKNRGVLGTFSKTLTKRALPPQNMYKLAPETPFKIFSVRRPQMDILK